MPGAGPKLYLVDAMSNIHRAYHAIQRLSTSAGRPTNAVYGFVTMLRKMLRENAPGVPGVGQVTAKKWVSAYGNLTALLEKAGEIKGKVGESLRQHREAALLSRRLVEIPTDLPIELDTRSLKLDSPDLPSLKE